MKNRLAAVTDVAVLLMAVLVATVLIKNYFLEPPKPFGVSVGDTLPAARWFGTTGSAKRELLIVLKKGCPYCEGSAPFYRELAQLQKSGRTAVGLLAVFEESPDTAKAVLRAEEVSVTTVGGVSLRTLKIRVTPTLLLVDDQRNVLKVWEGQLSRQSEDEVKAVLTES
jgi:hypothetical protein